MFPYAGRLTKSLDELTAWAAARDAAGDTFAFKVAYAGQANAPQVNATMHDVAAIEAARIKQMALHAKLGAALGRHNVLRNAHRYYQDHLFQSSN